MQNRSNRNHVRRPYSSRGSFSSRDESRWNDRNQGRENFSSYNEDEDMRDFNMENSSPRRDFDFEGGTRRRDYSSQSYSDRDYRGNQSYGGGRRNLREESYGSEQSERSERESFAGRGPKSYSRSDDRIREDVCEMLTRNPDIDAHDVDVEVKSGEVTLSGTVPQRRMKHLAEDLAERISSVRDVTNNIRVQRESTHDWSTQSEMGSDSEANLDSGRSDIKGGRKANH
ncbi:BON domain-containing protein [Bdellovibrio sp. HCB290]|uniref:BON domain-containing protein n=1 Tax=Bdellovibrio sp. HCB290 TaxID=3394356 RepID=UPI0039B54351